MSSNKKHRASVVFSDGSKNWAHNLDDLRERWFLARNAEAKIKYIEFESVNEPDWKYPESQEQASEWIVALSGMRDRLVTRQKVLKQEKATLSTHVYQAYWLTIQTEIDYRTEAISYVKRKLGHWKQKENQRRKRDEQEQAHKRKIEKIVISQGINDLSDTSIPEINDLFSTMENQRIQIKKLNEEVRILDDEVASSRGLSLEEWKVVRLIRNENWEGLTGLINAMLSRSKRKLEQRTLDAET